MGETERTCGREGCDTPLIATNKSGYCTKHFYDSRRKSAPGPARTCSLAGCGKALRCDNRTGMCTPCGKKARKKTRNADDAPVRHVRATVRASHADQQPPSNGVATLTVSEAQLDTMWSRFSLAEKAEVVQGFLERRQ